MDFREINSRGKRGELSGRVDRQNSHIRTAKTTIIKFGLSASFVELEFAKSALNKVTLNLLVTKSGNAIWNWIWIPIRKRVSLSPCQNDRHIMEDITGLYRYDWHSTTLPVIWRIGERTIPYSWRACEQLHHFECYSFVDCVIRV
ncbi:hypothetical protein TNCV_930771 [Trichonephila clavipes]|uniref:Uncharacterized protein n=1 Tax=Trichonephila clavipes TaxID=2585209 RepID=A0A8X6W362_TRICX|nr:hypothetical protein TNCV_930771 [Trichonephila clavipes]